MKIVLAPDSFKGSLTAREACDMLETGIRRVFPDAEIIKVPMADGGEGTVQSLLDALGGRIVSCEATGPLGQKVDARYGILADGTAVLEMAEASGLNLVPADRRNPMLTTSFGTGEVIKDALDKGCRKFIIGIGGSATNDGGAGMAQALGFRLLDDKGGEIPRGGGGLRSLVRIDGKSSDPRIKTSEFTVACDVDNPLCGPNGASHVFGPQKGATPDTAACLDGYLANYAAVVAKDLGIVIANVPGAGAAGGLGGGMLAFLRARLKPGVQIVLDLVGLEEKIKGADLVVTGEGCCDAQTLRGKTPLGVAKTALRQGVPVIIVAGSLRPGCEQLYDYGVVSMFSLIDKPMELAEAQACAPGLMADAAERIMRLLKYWC